jgi:hypothetical protein
MSRFVLLDKPEQPAEKLDLGSLGKFEVDQDTSGLLVVARFDVDVVGNLWGQDGLPLMLTSRRAGQQPLRRIKVTSSERSS